MTQQSSDALVILTRIINLSAFMTTGFKGDGRPVTSIKFDSNEDAWAFVNALGDARKLADAVASKLEASPNDDA